MARKSSGPKIERSKKNIIASFKGEELNMVSEGICSHITDFLDITMDLKTGTIKPYRKPNDQILYISALSNHPPNIIKELPRMIEKRIAKLCTNEDIFNQAKGKYEEALKSSGYKVGG